MNSALNLQVMVLVILFTVLSNSKADPIDSLKVIVSMFSGRPDPEYTITDTQSISFIKRRLDQYNLRSDPGDADAPMPLSNLGYRGVAVIEPKANSIYQYFLSNGAAAPYNAMQTNRFFDRHRELEKMVIRMLKKELIIHPQPDTQPLSILHDSLTSDYSFSGFLTIEMNNKFSTDGISIDISQLGNGFKYLAKTQDSISAVDFTVRNEPGDKITFRSAIGVSAMQKALPGLPYLAGTQPDSSSTLIDTYRSVLFLAKIKPDSLTYQQQVSCDNIRPTGTTFIIKTSENGYAAIVTAGTYIGGIDRLHLFYYFTTSDKLAPVNQTVNIKKEQFVTNSIIPAHKKGVKVTLAGQKINNDVHVNQVFPGKGISVK